MNEIQFVQSLTEYNGTNVFNPWLDYDQEYDIGVNAPTIRRLNLTAYLGLRSQVDYIFMAEALGYQGGHFSGVALTCERMLLGYHAVQPQMVFGDYKAQRTSSPALVQGLLKEKGFNEPTDTVVWGALMEHKIDPFKVVMWNIFPFHPHQPGDLLSNRTPTQQELLAGFKYFQSLQSMYPAAKVVAIGRKCADTLAKFKVDCVAVPHPSMGGANKFREQVAKLIRS